MKLIYAYPAELGPGLGAEILDTLRDRVGDVVQVAREERDAERGNVAGVFVTLEIGDPGAEEALNTLRTHPAVIDAAAESFGERV